MSSDPRLSDFVREIALGSDDKAEWYEQQAWRMVDRAAALEAVAAAASHRRAMGKAATKAIEIIPERTSEIAAYHEAMAAKMLAEAALDAALDVLEASDG